MSEQAIEVRITWTGEQHISRVRRILEAHLDDVMEKLVIFEVDDASIDLTEYLAPPSEEAT